MRKLIVAGLLFIIVTLVGLAVWSALRATTFPIAPLAHKAPKRTALMLQREAEARAKGRPYRIDQRWVAYERVAPLLRRAILVAEDAAFYEHGGLDWHEIGESARKNLQKRQIARGGSTITQQLARNLFLGDERTITRKLTEAFIAMRMERELSKRRIFELYLNLIEWGDGVFGIEAASRRYFGVPASALNERQALLLAAVIINPHRYSVTNPQRRIERRVRMIAGRLRRRGDLDAARYQVAIGAPPLAKVDSVAGSTDSLTEVPVDSFAPPAPNEPAARDTSPAIVDSLASPSSP